MQNQSHRLFSSVKKPNVLFSVKRLGLFSEYKGGYGMPKLRKSVIDSVLDNLELTRFGLAAYKVDFPERGDSLFKIVFSPDPQYFLSC